MALVQTQVAEIWVEATESRGTGYLLCSGCLLTAHHVIKDCPDTGVSFRLLGDFQADPDRWLHSSRIWFNETLDIALVFFSENEQRLIGQGITIPPIARLEPSQTIVCQACGFPAFAQTEGRYRDYSLKGQLTPFGSVKEPALAKFKIEDEIPNSGMQAWKGFSGSPVFTENGLLAGIVTQGFEEFRGEVLEVLAIGWLIEHHEIGQVFRHQVESHSRSQILLQPCGKPNQLSISIPSAQPMPSHHPAPSLSRVQQLKLDRLQGELKRSEEEYIAVQRQLETELDPVNRSRLERRLAQFEQEMEKIEQEIVPFCTPAKDSPSMGASSNPPAVINAEMNTDLINSLLKQRKGLQQQLEATTDELLAASGAQEMRLNEERNLIAKKITKVDRQLEEAGYDQRG